MRSLSISFRRKLVKFACGYDEQAERWYVADHNVDGEALPTDADSRRHATPKWRSSSTCSRPSIATWQSNATWGKGDRLHRNPRIGTGPPLVDAFGRDGRDGHRARPPAGLAPLARAVSRSPRAARTRALPVPRGNGRNGPPDGGGHLIKWILMP